MLRWESSSGPIPNRNPIIRPTATIRTLMCGQGRQREGKRTSSKHCTHLPCERISIMTGRPERADQLLYVSELTFVKGRRALRASSPTSIARHWRHLDGFGQILTPVYLNECSSTEYSVLEEQAPKTLPNSANIAFKLGDDRSRALKRPPLFQVFRPLRKR